MKKAGALVHTWLVLDFFADARASGAPASTLTTTIFTQSFLALVFAALLFPDTPPVPFAAANLCLSSLLVAIGALGDPDRRARRLADRTLLASAPIGSGTVAAARGCHAAFHVCLVTVGMALPPGILLAFLRGEVWQMPAYLLAACACSGLATGGLGTLVRVLERPLGHARTALLMGTGKALLLGGGLVLFALGLRRLEQGAASMPIGRTGIELLPPYHAARVLDDPAAEAWRVLPFLGGGLLLWLVAALAGEAEDDAARRGGGAGLLRRLLSRLTGRGPALAIADFVAISMWRSPGFRSRVLPLLGMPAGMAFLAAEGASDNHGFALTCLLLQLPAIYLPFLIAFLPRADQAEAGWVFTQAPHLDLTVVRDATWRALVTHVLVPIHGTALVLLLAVRPDRIDVLGAAAFAAGIAVLACRPMLRSLDHVPFSRATDGAPTDLGSLFTAALALGGLGTAFGIALPPELRLPVGLLVAAAGAWSLRRPPPRPAPANLLPSQDPAPGPSEQAPVEEDLAAAAPPQATPALRRELHAIGVLYLALMVLPCLVGAMFGP